MSALNVGDVVRVYDGNGDFRGSATVSSGSSVSFNLDIFARWGFLFVTVESIGKTESESTQRNLQ